jgi:hypothetical protein
MAKGIVMLGATLGSIGGGYMPSLWGDTSALSFISLLFGTIGGIVGIWAGYKVSQYIDE